MPLKLRISVIALCVYTATVGSCNYATQQDSYVKSFGYLGKTDSAANGPTLSGFVTIESEGREVPLAGATIRVEEKTTETDNSGKFSILTVPGNHKVVITKFGYKKLELNGYTADSNEHAHTEVMLRKGLDKSAFFVGKTKIKSSNHIK